MQKRAEKLTNINGSFIVHYITNMYSTEIVGILITMLLSAFFSGMEIAFVSSNRMLAVMDKDRNRLASR